METGQAALKGGDAGAAREAFKEAAAIRIGDPVVRRLLADACLREGDKVQAREALRDVVKLQPSEVGVLSRLAKVELELGDSEAGSETTKAAGAALKRHMRRRTAAFASAPAKAARALTARILGRAPDFRTAWLCHEAGTALAERRLADAGDLLARAEERAPDDADVLRLKAELLGTLGRQLSALDCAVRAHEARPDDLRIRRVTITAFARAGYGKEALEHFEGIPAKAKERPDGKLAQAYAHWANGRLEEARDIFAALLESDAASAEVAYNLAYIEAMRGNFEAAHEVFQQSAELAPHWGQIYWGATISRCMEKDDTLFERARRLSEEPEASQLDRALAELSVGRALIGAGEHGRGFAHLKKGNELVEMEYDPAEQEARIDLLIESFPQSLYSGRRLPDRGEGRIFIVGLPRSGSTLIEQILASHPMVHGAGEPPTLPRIFRRLENEHGLPGMVSSIDTEELTRAAEEYLAGVGVGPNDEPFTTDKALYNVYSLGLIALLFPKAKIVHCRRDPMDNGYSIYAHHFSAAYPYATDLRNIGHYFGQYERLMGHWAKTSPIGIHEVVYERLVEAPEQEIRRLLDALDIPFDDACLRFHESQRPVATSSLAQVREGINRKSVGGWRRFEAELRPLREMLDHLESAGGNRVIAP